MERLRTREELAKHFRISRMQLYRWAKINPLPVFYTGWGRWNRGEDSWTTEDADKWRKETEDKLRKKGYYVRHPM